MGNGAYGIDVFAKHFSVAAYEDKCMTADWSDLVPETVAEMGPGGGIGAGLAALVFGAKTYYTFEGDLRSMQLDAMVALNEIIFLVNNGYVPRNSQSPEIARGMEKPPVDDQWGPLDGDIRFPYFHYEPFSAEKARARIPAIVAAIKGDNNSEASINRITRWHEGKPDEELFDKIDFVWSHAVMEHVARVAPCYARLTQYVKPGGKQSHQIDMTSHSRTEKYNGHYAWSAFELAASNGQHHIEDIINGLAPTFHKKTLEGFGNEVTFNGLRRGTNGIKQKHPECTVPEAEVDVAGQFIQVMKR